jgi:hypothetical protein
MVMYVICVYYALLQVRLPRLRKLVSLELTTGMSVTATDYTYTLYNGQKFFWSGMDMTDILHGLHMHVHE